MAIRAVLFDLGNTLWHIPDPPPVEEIRGETMRRIFALFDSWNIEPEGELRFLGRDIRLSTGAADRTAYEGDCISPHFPTVVQEVVASKGLELSPERAEELWQTWNLGGPFFRRRLFEDAIDTLKALRDAGYRIGCVTNRVFGGPSFVEEVEEHGLADLLEVMSVSCDIGYMKPHPQIFQHALQGLGVTPQETIMVGDSLRADVRGAQELGMTGVWRRRLKSTEQVDGVRPDFVVDELREVPQLPCFT